MINPYTFWQGVAENSNEQAETLKAGMENLASMRDPLIAQTPKELVHERGGWKLFRYKAKVRKPFAVPMLTVYALVNRPDMLDLKPSRSLIANLLDEGIDVYLIDWGYPKRMHQFLELSDYIEFIDDCIDHLREESGLDAVNLMGICQGGAFSTVYSCLNPEKVKNLVATVTPVDFHCFDGLLNGWSQEMDVDLMVETFGNIPGDWMNGAYSLLQPFTLNIQKYMGVADMLGDKAKLEDFLAMERWIFDSPDQAGKAFSQFIKWFYQENRLLKGTLEINGQKVSLKNLTMPILNIYGEFDTLVPPDSSRALKNAGSTDYEELSYPVGHIGIFVSGKTNKTLAPNIAKWLKKRA